MKKSHLLPSLLLIFLASCQYQGLRLGLTEDEIRESSLEDLLAGQGLEEAEVKEQLGKSAEALLCEAASEGWLSVVHKLLLQGVSVDGAHGAQELIPLHFAVINGHTEITRLLLKEGAPVNSLDKLGRSPLQYAAFQGFIEIVCLLLENGATVDNKDEDCYTPLNWAALGGRTGVVALLLSHGADLTIQHKSGETALQMARGTTASFLELAAGKSKKWLKAYYEGFIYKQKHERDKEKVHTYARVYADIDEEVQDQAYASAYADHYTSQDLTVRSEEWVKVYAYMRADGESTNFSETAAGQSAAQIEQGRSFEWSYAYGIAKAEERKDAWAIEAAGHYEKRREEGKSKNWSYAYSRARAEDKGHFFANTLAGHYEERAEPGKLLRGWVYIYARERTEGKSEKGAEYVADGEGFYPGKDGSEPIRHLPLAVL